ncbi:hypothetical protein KY330_03590 [Candidatus Woesearchaeota archaeon]|nr:hypothetical protein [Candidatus Woesearchaeota archaeon]
MTKKKKIEENVRDKYAMHVHSHYSDGKRSLESLAREIRNSDEFEGFFSAEHDTVAGAYALGTAAKQAGIIGVPGIEFGATVTLERVPILIEMIGYNLRPANNLNEIEEICRVNQRHRIKRIEKMIYDLNKLLFGKYASEFTKITLEEVMEDVASGCPVGRPNLAQVLHKRKIVSYPKQAFYMYLDKFSPESCFHERDAVNVIHVVDAIIKAKGIVVAPHPGNIELYHKVDDGITNKSYFTFLVGLARSGRLHGVEAKYPYDVREKACDSAEHANYLNQEWEKHVNAIRTYSRTQVVLLRAIDFHDSRNDVPLLNPEYAITRAEVKKLFYVANRKEEFSRLKKKLKK